MGVQSFASPPPFFLCPNKSVWKPQQGKKIVKTKAKKGFDMHLWFVDTNVETNIKMTNLGPGDSFLTVNIDLDLGLF
jgi:hypothetical protein